MAAISRPAGSKSACWNTSARSAWPVARRCSVSAIAISFCISPAASAACRTPGWSRWTGAPSGRDAELPVDRKLYAELIRAELGEYLAAQSDRFDLIVSADTLVYFGALEPVLAAAAKGRGALLVAMCSGRQRVGRECDTQV